METGCCQEFDHGFGWVTRAAEIRAAEIRTANERTNRPTTRLFPLEVNEDDSLTEIQQVSPSDVIGDIEDTGRQDRPTRDATVTARKKLKEWANLLRAALKNVAN